MKNHVDVKLLKNRIINIIEIRKMYISYISNIQTVVVSTINIVVWDNNTYIYQF